ncbi:hypothetical protein VE04_06425 [Pseudogymnoascus sp. 24MN13]|nr:hypothetical protein VE04_06425 [Pseudogymnoascus sp. 24MN13]
MSQRPAVEEAFMKSAPTIPMLITGGAENEQRQQEQLMTAGITNDRRNDRGEEEPPRRGRTARQYSPEEAQQFCEKGLLRFQNDPRGIPGLFKPPLLPAKPAFPRQL